MAGSPAVTPLAPARTLVVVADAFLLLTGLAWPATCGVILWPHDHLVGVGLVAAIGAVVVVRVVRGPRGRAVTLTPAGFLAGEGPVVPRDSVTTVRIPALSQGRLCWPRPPDRRTR